MLLMSSWMSTVLPTPAPPNRPTLPPLVYGASRSTTLMPVSSSSTDGLRSSYLGAPRWIGQVSPSSTGWLSIASPITLKMRPSVRSPTGTLIGPPVSVRRRAAAEAVGGVHGDGAHATVAEVLLHLRHELGGAAVAVAQVDLERVVDRGQVPVLERDVEHDALDLDDAAGLGVSHVSGSLEELRCTEVRWVRRLER